VAEHYFNGMAPDVPHLLMSVSKSVTSAVAGVLAGRGLLQVSAAVEEIVPELGGTSFEGATVQDLLDMRAGTRFDESYENLEADVRTYERVYLWRPDNGDPRPADALGYFATLQNDGPHGGPFRYRSILTDVLAWVIERAGGARLHDLISRELWQPMGTEFDAQITLDAHGNPMADGGICASLRDLARFGQLYLQKGMVGDRSIVPAAWIDDTIKGAPDGADAFAAAERDAAPGAHYRNCWWVWRPDVPFYQASGINGQAVYVHVPSQTVVAKFSTWPTALSVPAADHAAYAVLAISSALQDGQLGG